MNIRILVISVCLFAACKKNNDPSHIIVKGIVLNKEGNMPLADARVTIGFNIVTTFPFSIGVVDSTQTNSRGEYEFSLPYKKGMQEYWLMAKKDSLQQTTHNQNHIAKGIDTLILEKPSYIHLTVKLTRQISDSIVCSLHSTSGWQPIPTFYELAEYRTFKQTGTYTIVSFPFSYTLCPGARVVLTKPLPPPSLGMETVAEKTFTTSAYSTTHAEIEY